ncbi:radical SAM protein [bacterium]|nr:radical SAM protein [bacterium]
MNTSADKPKPEGDGRLDVLLIYPPWAALEKRAILQNNLPPLGVLSIASYLESKGYRVGIVDVHAERLDEKEVAERVARARPRFVGIAVLTNMSIPAHAIARIVKREVPDCTVVVGGVHAEAMPERMLRNSAVDLVVRGDGEDAMWEILSGKPITDILGLSYREGMTVRHNPPRPVEMNLDKFPFPAYHLIDFDNYFPAAGSYRNLPAINMLMTRGCPGQCTFCNSAFTTLRWRSPERVVEQIKMLRYEHGIRQVMFYDDTFTVAKQVVLRFCKKMVEDKVDVTWTAYVRGDCFNDEMAAAMKAAGCHQVLMGIETGDEEIMKVIQKPINKERYHKAVKTAHDNGLEVRASFIIGNVGETFETMRATLNFAIELDVDIFQLNINTPYPGTQLYSYADPRGMLLHKNWHDYGQGQVIVKLDTLTPQDIYDFEKYAWRRFYIRPKMLLRQLKRIGTLRHIKDLYNAFSMLIIGAIWYRTPKWGYWKNFKEEDLLDMPISEPQVNRLTYELRQGAAAFG